MQRGKGRLIEADCMGEYSVIGREEQQAECEQQIANLTGEVVKLSNASHETESQQEKLAQVNQKMKRALQSFKDKIQRVAVDRPQLFVDVGEETSERLDHLIATVANQATQIDTLQAERDQLEQQSNTQIRDLQRYY